jgi:nitrous oxidase accessory protein NosD
MRDRPVSVVVGEDAPTVSAAIEQAPPNTTVQIPPGEYESTATVDKPLTLRGAGAETVLDGDGRGTVLTVTAPGVAVTDIQVTGVGNTQSGELRPDNGSEWDRRIRLVYGYGDAGMRLQDAPGALVENVTVQTPSNGIVALNSTRSVVRNVTVEGTENPREGFMSVMPMYSRIVVEDSTFRGNRDAVYTHYADGTVVRNNDIRNLRYGYHAMYTSDALVYNNTVRNTLAGVMLMTRPSGNAQIANDVRDSEIGILTVGRTAYTADNVLVGNDIGLSIGASRSVYRDNTIVDNDVGIRSSTLLPTNDVYANDVLGNDEPVVANLGTLNEWAVDGQGNYWGEVPGIDRDDDGVVDRVYRPTDPIDRSADVSPGSHTLAHSPAVTALRQFQQAAPGLRESTIVDPAPLAEPANPDRLDALNESTP